MRNPPLAPRAPNPQPAWVCACPSKTRCANPACPHLVKP